MADLEKDPVSNKLRISLDEAITSLFEILRRSPWSQYYGEKPAGATSGGRRQTLGEIYSSQKNQDGPVR